MFSIAGKFVLHCSSCGAEFPEAVKTVCDECFGPLKIRMDLEQAGKTLSKNSLSQRSANAWRYFELYPVNDRRKIVDLGTGWTPLVKAEKLGEKLGLKNLWIKNDAVNPTYSFKDRPVTVGTTKAVEFGFKTLSCSSTGNLAASVGAHAAKAGLDAYVFIPASIELNKIAKMFAYGAKVIAVNGIYDVANRLSNEAADKWGWAVLNVNIRPYYQEGEKSIAFESVEQLGWQAPDAVVVPMGSGGLLYEIHKALEEFTGLGFIKPNPTRFYGAQGENASPIVDAFKKGGEIIPLKEPRTIAKSIAMGAPGDGDAALGILRKTKGGGENPSDAEILEGIRLLAQTEGILTEPAGGTTIGALKRLAEQGAFDSSDLVIAFITGNGLKTQEAIPKGTAERIEPKIEEVEKILRKHGKIG